MTDNLKSLPEAEVILSLEKISSKLRDKGEKVLDVYIARSIESARQNYRNKCTILKDVVDVVNVVIPVYKDYKETLEYIESVLKAKNETPFEVVVIDDCSPDQFLKDALKSLAEQKQITLIINNENLGFVKSVNIGMKLHPDRDVILLNSDTLVPDYWINRLRRAAYSSKSVATVTPFSNRATILSLPIPNYDNNLPDVLSYHQLDAICRKVNAEKYIEIPTVIGFCMYIKRECLREIGYFDEDRFDKGYREENDFCVRASVVGWKYLACLDLFVFHHGSLSFKGGKA